MHSSIQRRYPYRCLLADLCFDSCDSARSKKQVFTTFLLNRRWEVQGLACLTDLTFELCDWDLNADSCFAIIQNWVVHSKDLYVLKLKLRLKHESDPTYSLECEGTEKLVQKMIDFLSIHPKVEYFEGPSEGWAFWAMDNVPPKYTHLFCIGDELRFTFPVYGEKLDVTWGWWLDKRWSIWESLLECLRPTFEKYMS